jgi:hypothetical protein
MQACPSQPRSKVNTGGVEQLHDRGHDALPGPHRLSSIIDGIAG